MSDTASVLDSLKEYNADDIFNIIMHTAYFPTFFVIQCIYVVFHVRSTIPPSGCPWYRSFILGTLMVEAPRIVFTQLMDRVMPGFEDEEFLKYYAIVWCLYNLVPFDLVYKFTRRASFRYVLQLLASVAQAQLIGQMMQTAIMVFQNKPLRIASTVLFATSLPVWIDTIDRIIFGQRRFPMLYHFGYAKRLAVIVGYMTIFGAPGVFEENAIMLEMNRLIEITCLVLLGFTLFDLILLKGKSFSVVDIFFPNFFKDTVRYYPAEQ